MSELPPVPWGESPPQRGLSFAYGAWVRTDPERTRMAGLGKTWFYLFAALGTCRPAIFRTIEQQQREGEIG